MIPGDEWVNIKCTQPHLLYKDYPQQLLVCFCREQECSARAVAPHKINCFMLVVGLRGNKRGSFSHDQVPLGF